MLIKNNNMPRQFACFLFVAVGLFVGARSVSAATIIVNSIDPGFASQKCTLEAALFAAQIDKKWSGCETGNGADKIIFSIGTPGSFLVFKTLGELKIDHDVTIDGGTKNIVIDGDKKHRILHIVRKSGATKAPKVVLNNIFLQNGDASTSPSNLYGGGILNEGGDLTLNDCKITHNYAKRLGGGIANSSQNSVLKVNGGLIMANTVDVGSYSAPANGAGVFNRGTASFDNVKIQENKIEDAEDGNGGGISQTMGSLVIKNNTVIKDNVATWLGGGISVTGGNVTISDSTISGNLSEFSGGGVSVGKSVGSVAINRSEIKNNSTDSDTYSYGGGLYVSAGNKTSIQIEETRITGNKVRGKGKIQGGGLYDECLNCAAPYKTHTILSSTIDNNSTEDEGGGVYIQGGNILFENVTIGGNKVVGTNGDYTGRSGAMKVEGSGAVHVRSSTIAFNQGGIETWGNPRVILSNTILANLGGINCYGKLYTQGYNIFETLSVSLVFPCTVKELTSTSHFHALDVVGSGAQSLIPGLFAGIATNLSSGGSVPTYGLTATSRAMDGGIPFDKAKAQNPKFLDRDALKLSRYQGLRYDVGAREKEAKIAVTVKQTLSDTTAAPGAGLVYVVKVKNNSTAGTALLNKLNMNLKAQKGIYFKSWTCTTSGEPRNWCYQKTANYGSSKTVNDVTAGLDLLPGGEATFTFLAAVDSGFSGPMPSSLKTIASVTMPEGVMQDIAQEYELTSITVVVVKKPAPPIVLPHTMTSTLPTLMPPTLPAATPTITVSPSISQKTPVKVMVTTLNGTELKTGQSAKLDAMVVYSDGSFSSVTSQCAWSTSDAAKAAVQNANFMSLSGTGLVDATCTYSLGGKTYSGALSFTITAASVLQPVGGITQVVPAVRGR